MLCILFTVVVNPHVSTIVSMVILIFLLHPIPFFPDPLHPSLNNDQVQAHRTPEEDQQNQSYFAGFIYLFTLRQSLIMWARLVLNSWAHVIIPPQTPE